MPASMSATVAELEIIEGTTALHDFSGPHASKGFDYATYWVIVRVVELEKEKKKDYALVCEYVQDVAEFDSSGEPSTIRLYQLKKRETGYWKASDLTGQTGKKKVPKQDKPVIKLLNHVRTFKSAKASGVLVSNAHFDVDLASGEPSVNDMSIGLHDLDVVHTDGLKVAIAKAEGILPTDVDLSVVELRRVTLAFDDLQRHTSGVVLEYLQEFAPSHAGQASSLVETLFVRLKARGRSTERCKSWPELLTKRGFSRKNFIQAIESLKSIPNRAEHYHRLLDRLSRDWKNFRTTKVHLALTQCARDKVLAGEGDRWKCDRQLTTEICAKALAEDWPDERTFEQLFTSLTLQLPSATEHEISALAIHEMTEWTLNQTHA